MTGVQTCALPICGPVKRIYADEPREILKKETTLYMDVSAPLFQICFKDDIKNLSGDAFAVRNAGVEICLELLCGKSSPLFSRLYEKGLINSTFGSEYMLSESFGAAFVGGESKDPDTVYKELLEQADSLIKNGLLENETERCRKMLYGKALRVFDGTEKLANEAVSSYFYGTDLFETALAYKNISYDELGSIMEGLFRGQYSIISKILPRQ